MKLSFNFEKIICFCNGKSGTSRNEIEDLITMCKKIGELNQGLITFEILIGKILNFLSGDYGYINKAISNGIVVFRPLAVHGISVNDGMFLQRFYNVPLFYADHVFVGTLGFGGPYLKIDRIKLLDPILNIIAKQLYLIKN